jgi:Protein of unknown function (DUF5818)
MKRETSWSTVVFLLVTAPLMFSQGPQAKTSPALPSEILGLQLIAWSQAQKPQPVPQPLVPPARPVQQAEQSANAFRQDTSLPTAQTITGTIIKNGTQYVLEVAGSSSYELDDQDLVQQYEGKPVEVTATPEGTGSRLHVISIQLAS